MPTNPIRRAAVALVPLFWCALAGAAGDLGERTVTELGRLNGTALGCGYNELVPRAKGAMIHYAPKSREIGALFEQGTSEGFLAAVQAPERCPAAPALFRQVEAAVAELARAYPK